MTPTIKKYDYADVNIPSNMNYIYSPINIVQQLSKKTIDFDLSLIKKMHRLNIINKKFNLYILLDTLTNYYCYQKINFYNFTLIINSCIPFGNTLLRIALEP